MGRHTMFHVVARAAGALTISAALLGPAPASAAQSCLGLTATISGSGTICGTPDNDVIVGSEGRDVVVGNGGNDVVCTLGVNDDVTLGVGNDHVDGGLGDDTLSGKLGALSPRELDVLRLIVAGCSDKAIGERLFISSRTASQHVFNVLVKLGLGSRTAAATYVTADGLKVDV